MTNQKHYAGGLGDPVGRALLIAKLDAERVIHAEQDDDDTHEVLRLCTEAIAIHEQERRMIETLRRMDDGTSNFYWEDHEEIMKQLKEYDAMIARKE